MARITIDDCTDKIENRFDLVLLSAHRARLLLEGVTLGLNNSSSEKFEKKTVHALREISEQAVTPQQLQDSLIGKMQTEKKPKDLISDTLTSENTPKIFSVNYQDDEIYQATSEEINREMKKNPAITKEIVADDNNTPNFSDEDIVEDEE